LAAAQAKAGPPEASAAYPDSYGAPDLEYGSTSTSSSGSATTDNAGGAATAMAIEALQVLGHVGDRVASLCAPRVGAFAPSWMLGRGRNGCKTFYVMLVHIMLLHCYI
jgi:hypothetical protein